VAAEVLAEYKLTVERSRFHALLFSAASEGDLEQVLKSRRAQHRKANHHCWAIRILQPDGSILERSKDDGEVGHPGRILLELLQHEQLLAGLVVSRIFGGVKLGVGGVSRAFRQAGEGALSQTKGAPND
jgi:putative IMPACT (imprinted ancient) family translation regulator